MHLQHLLSAPVDAEGTPNFETVAKVYMAGFVSGDMKETSGTADIAVKGIMFKSDDGSKVRCD